MSTEVQKVDLGSVALGMIAGVETKPEVVAAQNAAKYALSLVVTDDITLQQAQEQTIIVSKGRKAVEAARKPIASIIKAASDALNAYAKKLSAPLEQAEEYIDNQIRTHVAREQAKRVEAERQEALRQEREAADARKAAAEAIAAGQPPPAPKPPPVQEFVAPVATKATTAVGAVHMTHTLKVEVVNIREVPEHLLMLAPGAQDWARDQVARGEVLLEKREGVEANHCGLRFFYVASVAKR